MSREKLWQICHKNVFNNRKLTEDIVGMLRRQGITTKQAALDLGMTVWRTHNWYHKNTGMSALDLLRMLQNTISSGGLSKIRLLINGLPSLHFMDTVCATNATRRA